MVTPGLTGGVKARALRAPAPPAALTPPTCDHTPCCVPSHPRVRGRRRNNCHQASGPNSFAAFRLDEVKFRFLLGHEKEEIQRLAWKTGRYGLS